MALGLLIVPEVAAAEDLEITVLSNRADLVSGGDALVEVVVPEGVDAGSVRVDVDGRDVTEAFGVRGNGRFYGLVTGLVVGDNVVTARSGASGARLVIKNHPIGGPVFSGPHLQPWECRTEGAGLGAAQDADCNAPTIYRFLYKSAQTGQFTQFDPATPPPAAQVATTTTDHGVTVPYIVRNERGTINRAIYDIAVLFDPSQPWTAAAPQPQWNHKFYYTFGGGCANKRWQTANSGAVMDDMALSRGFAVATTGLNVLGNNCNEVLSAEAVMMVKERLIDHYGTVRYTMSTGGSGGAVQQYAISASYPGLLNGIQPSATFGDITTTVNEVHDCKILLHYFDVTSPELWQVEEQRSSVLGHLSTSSCRSHQALNLDRSEGDPTYCGTATSTYTPTTGTVYAPGQSEAEWVYHPEDNPTGARCNIWDSTVNVWGRRPDGKANRPWNNIGIEYGRVALQSGKITTEQFVDLNEQVGGLDIDYNVTPAQRTAPDGDSVEIAYRSSRVATGAGLAQTAILDTGGLEDVELHTNVRAWSMKERMQKTNGTAENQAIIKQGNTGVTFPLLDQWLSAVEADTSDDEYTVKLLRNKPARAVDSCVVGSQHITDQNTCRNSGVWSYFANPRMAAGQSLADDVMQCQLKPMSRAEYNVTFTDAQWDRLQATFPTGVCNWALPSVGEQPPTLWATFADGPGGRGLGAPPVSEPLTAAPPTADDIVVRVSGPDRIETAAAIAREAFPQAAPAVVLARADVYADALAGAPLARALGAPLLLTPSDGLAPVVATELGRLGPQRIVLLGGTAALSQAVAEQVGQAAVGADVVRIAGANRFATASAVADELGADRGTVYVTEGEHADASRGWPDAVSVSSLAAFTGRPIVLVNRDRLPEESAATLQRYADEVVVVGGEAAVSAATFAELAALAPSSLRVSGADRYATSRAVYDRAVASGADASRLWLATGRVFADALAAGPAVAALGESSLLVDGTSLEGSPSTREVLVEGRGTLERVVLVGGDDVVSADVERDIRELLAG